MGSQSAELSIGDTIELKPETVVGAIPPERENNKTAKIQRFIPEIVGAFKTDRDLHGCRYWNVEHVRLAGGQEKKAEKR